MVTLPKTLYSLEQVTTTCNQILHVLMLERVIMLLKLIWKVIHDMMCLLYRIQGEVVTLTMIWVHMRINPRHINKSICIHSYT